MTLMPTKTQLIQEFKKINIDVTLSEKLKFVTTLVIQPLIENRVTEVQKKDQMLTKLREKVKYEEAPNFYFMMDDCLRTNRNKRCVLNDDELKRDILEEAL